MALGGNAILNAVASHALTLGLFDRVNQHEPHSAPGSGMTCAIWIDVMRADPRHSGLAATTAHLVFRVRIYSSAIQEPADAIDPQIIDAVDQLWAAYIGDFTLGALVMEVDVHGAAGLRLEALAGYVTQDGKQMRVMTITLPILVSDVWEEVP